MQKLLFEMPVEPIQLAQLVREIPNDFSWVDGYLLAPRKLYEQDLIARNTRFVISRYSTQPLIKGRRDVSFEESMVAQKEQIIQNSSPNLLDVFLYGGLVSSVEFDEAGFQSHLQPISEIKKLIEHFYMKDYRGEITLFRGYDDEDKYANRERVSFNHRPSKKTFITQKLPPHISVEWNPKEGGKIATLSGLIKGIERLDLKAIPLEHEPR